MSSARNRVGACVVTAAALWLVGCGGGGGDRPQPAEAGLVAGQAAQDPTQTLVTVRSGTELVLNGENSDGGRFPIRSSIWQQVGGPTEGIVLVKRTPLSDAVQIPQYDAPTQLTFELTVTNTDDDTSKSRVVANVIPVDDGDQFLEFLTDLDVNERISPNYTVIVALKAGFRAETDLDFSLDEERFAVYPNSAAGLGPANQQLVLDSSSRVRRILAGADATNLSGAQAINAELNANVSILLPQTDADDINSQFDANSISPDPGMVVPEYRNDSIQQFVRYSLSNLNGSCASATASGIPAADCLNLHALTVKGAEATWEDMIQSPQSSEPASNINRTYLVDILGEEATAVEAGSPCSSHPSASHRYYAAVDPNCNRTTLSDWLAQAGFPSRGEAGDGRNVLYINNYDLGFTRDMYMRRDGNGNVYAYVTNYPALRSATLDDGEFDEDIIATVAMEYTPPDQDTSSAPIVKFFVFIPDESGVHQRVTHLNFDGRGEKPVPESCVPCHGGSQYDPDKPSMAMGDVNAGFLPFDLDSLLFARVDSPDKQHLLDPLIAKGFELNPGYIGPEDLERFSLERQQDAFREMNEMVLTTFNHLDFNLVRTQLHAWYPQSGGAQSSCSQPVDPLICNDLADVPFDASEYIQEGWTNEAGYEVYARHCRICHSQIRGGFKQFVNFNELSTHQKLTQYLFQDGLMPNARLNMDRFWVDFRNPDRRPVDSLAAALGLTPTPPPPGAPIARITGTPVGDGLPRDNLDNRDDLPTPIKIRAKTNRGVRLSGATSSFATSYFWTVTAPDGSSVVLADPTSTDIGFFPSQVNGMDTTEYEVTLEVGGGNSGTTGATVEAVAPKVPMLTPTGKAIPVNAFDLVRIDGLLTIEPPINEAHLVVEDSDTISALIELTVTRLPTYGYLEVRSSSSAPRRIVENDRTFTLDKVLAVGLNGLFYVSTQEDPTITGTDKVLIDDSFALSIRDDEVEGSCTTDDCQITLDVKAGNGDPIVRARALDMTEEGFLDKSRSRKATFPINDPVDEMAIDFVNKVPWSTAMVDKDSLHTFDAEDAPEFLTYTVGSLPIDGNNQVVGYLKLGEDPIGDPNFPNDNETDFSVDSDDRILEQGDTFTQADVNAGMIYYENRQIGGESHFIPLSISDRDPESDDVDFALQVLRQLRIESDIGWVIDTVWISGQKCRGCHSPIPTDMPGASNVQWTDSAAAGGMLRCDNLAGRYPAKLPDYPTLDTGTHTGGIVFNNTSLPYRMLEAWRDPNGGVKPTCDSQ